MQSVAAAADISFRTAQRWVAQYQQFGLTALVRRKRADIGERRAVSEALRKAIEGLALQTPPLPIAALHRQVRQMAKDLGEHPPTHLGGLSDRTRTTCRPRHPCA
ncbi:MAG: helix-turn-helix domain-containing protein [Bryobacteraceae bacterium]|nr:helix-turn-helix domain-containing protein [Bryobacteraceae bacterium]